MQIAWKVYFNEFLELSLSCLDENESIVLGIICAVIFSSWKQLLKQSAIKCKNYRLERREVILIIFSPFFFIFLQRH